jgi:hypothetical protein
MLLTRTLTSSATTNTRLEVKARKNKSLKYNSQMS